MSKSWATKSLLIWGVAHLPVWRSRWLSPFCVIWSWPSSSPRNLDALCSGHQHACKERGPYPLLPWSKWPAQLFCSRFIYVTEYAKDDIWRKKIMDKRGGLSTHIYFNLGGWPMCFKIRWTSSLLAFICDIWNIQIIWKGWAFIHLLIWEVTHPSDLRWRWPSWSACDEVASGGGSQRSAQLGAR